MSAMQQVSSSNGTTLVNRLHQWGHQRWTNLSSRTGSGSQWSLAQKVSLFFLVTLGLILLIKSRMSGNTKIKNSSKKTHGHLGSSSSPKVVDAGVREEMNYRLTDRLVKVELHLPATLNITISSTGDLSNLSVSADQNILRVLKPQTDGTQLIIHSNDSFETNTPIQYTLTIPHLQEVVVSTTGKIVIAQLKGNSFTCTIKDDAQVSVSKGQVESQFITISENGKYHASNITTQFSTVSLTDHAEATIKTPVKTLDVKLSGDSTCKYKGPEPRFSHTSVTDHAEVKRA